MKMKLSMSPLPLVVLFAALFTSAVALAEPGSVGKERPDHHRGPPSAEEKLARISRNLDLDESQSVQMLEVLQDAEARHQDLRGQAVTEMGPDICQSMLQTDADILAILNEEQAAQWEEMKLQRKQHMGSRSGSDDPSSGRRGRQGVRPDCSEYDQNA